jgi:hypothetical protein
MNDMIAIVIPVNPLSVAWAKEAYDSQNESFMQPFPNLGVLSDEVLQRARIDLIRPMSESVRLLATGLDVSRRTGSAATAIEVGTYKNTPVFLWGVSPEDQTYGFSIAPVQDRDVRGLSIALLAKDQDRFAETSIDPVRKTPVFEEWKGDFVFWIPEIDRKGSGVESFVDFMFSQEKVGKNGKSFTSWKFGDVWSRVTAKPATAPPTRILKDEDGEVLFRFSEDEWLGSDAAYRSLATVRRALIESTGTALQPQAGEIERLKLPADETARRIQAADQLLTIRSLLTFEENDDLGSWKGQLRDLTRRPAQEWEKIPAEGIVASAVAIYSLTEIGFEPIQVLRSKGPEALIQAQQVVEDIVLEEQETALLPVVFPVAIVDLRKLEVLSPAIRTWINNGQELDGNHRLIFMENPIIQVRYDPEGEIEGAKLARYPTVSAVTGYRSLALSAFIARVQPVRIGEGEFTLGPVAETTRMLFSPLFVAKTSVFARSVLSFKERMEKKDIEVPPDQLTDAVYMDMMTYQVKLMGDAPQGPKKVPGIIQGGRAAARAFGGEESAIRTHRAQGSPDITIIKKRDTYATRFPRKPRSFLPFAIQIWKDLVEIQPGWAPSPGAPREWAIDPRLFSMMDELSIPYPRHELLGEGMVADLRTPDSRRAMKEALLKLKEKMTGHLPAHTSSKGHLFDQIGGSTDEIRGYRKDSLSRTNPRTGRRPRRIRFRESKTTTARGNPLDPEEVADLIKIVQDKNVSPEAMEHIRKKFERLSGSRDPLDWTFAPENVKELFLRRGKTRDFSAESRLSGLSRFDLVSRLRRQDDPDLDERLRTETDFWAKDTGSVVRQGELSLEETAKILRAQKEGRLRGTTMQAATALCQQYKVKAIKGYQPPTGFFETGGQKKVVLWLSPINQPFRIMTFRRNVHIDCDMSTKKGHSPSKILGAGLLATLLWLAEKPGRSQNTSVYLGRVGEAGLTLLWHPGDALTLSSIQARLKEPHVVRKGSWEGDLSRYLDSTGSSDLDIPPIPSTDRPTPRGAEDEELKVGRSKPILPPEMDLEEGQEPDLDEPWRLDLPE